LLIPKSLPVLIFALYAKTYSATRMVCAPYGFCLDAFVAGNRWRKKSIQWKHIKKIYVTPAKPGQRVLDRFLCFEAKHSAYLAHDTAGKQVVLKEYILPVYVDTRVRRRALETFEHEALMLSKLNNPSVVKLLDVFVEDHRGYLVLELIDGINLRDYVIKNGPVPESKVREWALSMAGILEYLHNQSPPVVHRDFTPDNLILLPDGSIKLIDFMVAQQETESATATVVGKHAYLPPEQFRGAAAPASDIYALGCTLHYLLTGADPEPLTSSHPILAVDSVSAEMDDFVAQCTCQDLGKRYRQAGDLIDELEHQQHPQA
jgi:serine/threonine protein kinase